VLFTQVDVSNLGVGVVPSPHDLVGSFRGHPRKTGVSTIEAADLTPSKWEENVARPYLPRDSQNTEPTAG